jgi:cell division protein FtsQ
MAPENRSGRREKRGKLYAPVAFLIICGAVVFSMSVFFRVSDIRVEGNARYSAEEIADAAGIAKGSNLFFINRFTSVSRIFSQLPYIESAGISREFPGRVVITVKESRALAYLAVESDFWLIDRNCKILEKVKADGTSGCIRVEGLTPIAPSAGSIVSPGEEETPKVKYLSAILTGLQERNMAQDVSMIDLRSAGDAVFRYQNRFTVKMGRNENVGYKLELLLSAVGQLAPGDSGTIDLSALSKDKKVAFSPD